MKSPWKKDEKLVPRGVKVKRGSGRLLHRPGQKFITLRQFKYHHLCVKV